MGLQEIATAAHVSTATVSRVINGSARVNSEIQKRVREAAASLGIDIIQRTRTRALAFLLSNREMLHAFHARMLVGAEACCAAHGWDMVFLSFRYSDGVPWKALHLPSVVRRRDVVRAVVLAGTNSVNLLELFRHQGVTFSVFGNNVRGGDARQLADDIVFSDDVGGGRDMTRHMIEQGHRDIWFIGNTQLPWFARCYEGYETAMRDAGLEPRKSVINSESDAEIGYLGTKSLLARGEPVTAIFAGNDSVAEGVYKALRDCRLRVPEDVSVVGCDDTYGALLHPGLSTIRAFPEQLGKYLVELVLNRIENPDCAPQHMTIPTQLVGRESSRPLGRAVMQGAGE